MCVRAAPLALVLAVPVLLARPLCAQAGDIKGEEQPPLPASVVVPPAPARTAEEERATFRVPDGLEVELVAGDPLIHDPVHAVFDARGRLWVVEMRGYMPDADGKGEREPNGSVALLVDDDGDGRMDRRTTFLDGLVLPRSVAVTRGGVLVIAPPKLLFAVDEDDDGVADDVKVVDQGLDGITSPEYGINGLLPTLDNAFASACTSWRYVFENGQWKRERTAGGGQWGITKDDFGRLYFNGNSDPLRGDRIPSHLACRNPNAGNAPGVNVRIVDDFHAKPARINPGVNRAYKPGTVGPDWKLDLVTGTCGPWIHRGDALPETYRGDAFVCEPCGNLVLRYELAEDADGVVKGTPARNADGLDFLTSTDERFRPVNLFDGPDGALYVVDLYRGLIQHRMFVTTFLRKQVEARGLAQPIGLGRIWRVKKKGAERKKPVDLTALGSRALAEQLASPNGWTRDTAQRLLVENGRFDHDADGPLLALVQSSSGAPRVHALWTLAGLDRLTPEHVRLVGSSHDEREVVQALQARRFLDPERASPVHLDVLRVKNGASLRVREHVFLTCDAGRHGEVWRLLSSLAAQDERSASAYLCGAEGRELELLRFLLGDATWWDEAPARAAFVGRVARCIARDGRSSVLEEAVELLWKEAFALRSATWKVRAALEGLVEPKPKDPAAPLPRLFLEREPRGLAQLLIARDAETAERAKLLDERLVWPGKPGAEGLAPRALTEAERARFAQGRELYAANCVACHQTSGRGDPALAPALRSSPWVLGSDEKLARILLHGLNGPIDVLGQHFESEMPAFALGDAELAAILTYVRREWGNTAEPVEPDTFARVRKSTADRKQAWSAKELEALGR